MPSGTGTGGYGAHGWPRPAASRRAGENLGSIAVRDGSRAEVSVALGDRALRIREEDDGPGIAEEYREKAFELLTTLRPRDACEGSGVGLALARKIVEAAGGVIGLEHVRAGRGLCVSIHLPKGEDLVN